MKDEIRDSLLAPPAITATIDKKLKIINPSTEEVLNEYELISKEQLNDAVKKSKNAFLEWKRDIDKRAAHYITDQTNVKDPTVFLSQTFQKDWLQLKV